MAANALRAIRNFVAQTSLPHRTRHRVQHTRERLSIYCSQLFACRTGEVASARYNTCIIRRISDTFFFCSEHFGEINRRRRSAPENVIKRRKMSNDVNHRSAARSLSCRLYYNIITRNRCECDAIKNDRLGKKR